VLDEAARRAAVQRIASDRAFAARVSAWEVRLADLNSAYAPTPAPAAIFDAIETRLFDTEPRRSLWQKLWPAAGLRRGLALAALAAVAVLGYALLNDRLDQRPNLITTLEAPDGGLTFVAVYDPATEKLNIRQTLGQPHAQDKDFELWLILPEQQPISLGLVTAQSQDRTLPARLAAMISAGVTLAVSLEPAGGSTTGLPTGPVVAVGEIQAL